MKNLLCDENSVYLITDRLTRKYLCGVDVAEATLLVHDGGAVCLTDARYFYAAKETMLAVGVDTVLYKGFETLKEQIGLLAKEKLWIDFSRETVKDFNLYKSFSLEILDCSLILEKMRSVKTEEEISLIKKACTIAETAYHSAIKMVEEGMSELQLKSLIEKEIIRLGGDGPSFDIIVAFGKNSAVPHHVTGETRLEKGLPILVDMGAIVDGYMSDITRTAFFGEPSEKFVRCYEAVKKANELAEEKISVGMKTCDCDAIAREYLKAQDLSEYFTHSLGHGVGMEIHEFPTLSKRTSDELKENTVFTIEPGVYFDGEFGIRVEDTVVIKNGKVERLFADSKELEIIK